VVVLPTAGVPSRIERLPDTVVDQIAAGEVIERPASVIKELIDNALDAGARSITVELEAGGRGSLRVVDDGHGMSADDLPLALTRHATSKLRSAADLVGIDTMGFRGEALPSIASVARVTIVSRRAEDAAGWKVEVEGGVVVASGPAGAPVGTSVTVRDLFWTVPARLKFLRSDATETSHIVETVGRVAMAHPAVHVRLASAGRALLDVPSAASPLARARELLGVRIGADLVEVVGEEHGVRVRAFLAAPEAAQATARGVQLFVGRRPVRDRGLLHAVAMAYGELVPRGRYPVAVVMLDVPGPGLDVNVHPQKLEVRFRDAAGVQAAVRHVLRRGVATASWSQGGAATLIQMTAVTSVVPPRVARADLAATYAAKISEQRLGRAAVTGPAATERPTGQGALDLAAPGSPDSAWSRQLRAALAARERPTGGDAPAIAPRAVEVRAPDAPAASPAPEVGGGFFAGLRFLGQLDATFLVCDGGAELVLIDQHVAHERVVLAGLRRAGAAAAVQRLLFPQTLALGPELVEIARAQRAALAALGFELVDGAAGVALAASPAGLRQPVEVVLRDLLLAARADPAAIAEGKALATVACHSAMRAGDALAPAEASALLAAMDAVDFREPGLHQRPVLLRLSVAEIARRFGR
jgi:DNA mismatch repair protein MutL